jgi:hypothetical protein
VKQYAPSLPQAKPTEQGVEQILDPRPAGQAIEGGAGKPQVLGDDHRV